VTPIETAPAAVSPPTPAPSKRPTALLVAIGIIVALVVSLAVTIFVLIQKDTPTTGEAAVTPSATTAATFIGGGYLELAGTFVPAGDGESCRGSGGYSDIAAGSSVTITDSSGKVVALGQLEDGRPGLPGTCALHFRVEGIPRGSGFYGVEVSHRGKVQVRESELAVGRAQLALGH